MLNEELLNRLHDIKQQAEASKTKLNGVSVTEESGGGLVRVTMNGNRQLLSVDINTPLSSMDKEDLEDLLCVALNRALDKVNELNEQEVMDSTKSLFPGF